LITNTLRSQDYFIPVETRVDISNRVNVANISIKNVNLIVDDSIKVKKGISLCEILLNKLKKLELGEIERVMCYVSISLDLDTRIELLDSIHNELKAINLLSVNYKINNSPFAGIFMRIPPKSEEIERLYISSNLYFPNCIDDSRKVEENNFNSQTNTPGLKNIPLPPPPPPAPKIFDPFKEIPKLDSDSMWNEYKVHLISVKNDNYLIDNKLLNKTDLEERIQNIIYDQDYLFVVDMNNEHKYHDYLLILDIIFQKLYLLRDNHPDKRFKLRLVPFIITDKNALNIKDSGNN